MASTNPNYDVLAYDTVASTPVPYLLVEGPAVVLERIACGGGETRWYYCAGRDQLKLVTSRLRPGSAVSFYFDGRIRRAVNSDDLLPHFKMMLEKAAGISGAVEIVLGVLAADGVSIKVDFPSSIGEIEEQLLEADPALVLFFGFFPSRDNDGKQAVSLDLPDSDGVLRTHPH
jgi:hypothetical protein